MNITWCESWAKKFSGISLSNYNIQRRIVDMSDDIFSQLIEQIKQSQYFILQIHESTDVPFVTQLITFVWENSIFFGNTETAPDATIVVKL